MPTETGRSLGWPGHKDFAEQLTQEQWMGKQNQVPQELKGAVSPPRRTGSLEPGLSSCSAQSSLLVVHRLSGSIACGILVPQPGIEPESPALEGEFLTPGPPGKSHFVYFYSVACDSSQTTQTYESDLAYISLLFYPRLSS